MQNLLEKFFKFILNLIATPKVVSAPAPDPIPVPSVPHETPVMPKPDYLTLMCEAIRDFEGKPGDRNYKNNNPGNLRNPGGDGWALAIGYDDKKFAIFHTMKDGMNTLRGMIVNAATGKSHVYNPKDTLVTFFRKYAPASDNNHPEGYASNVAKRMGVSPFEFRLMDLVS